MNRLLNSVDPDETAHDEPSHLDQYCFQKCLSLSAVLKELNKMLKCYNYSEPSLQRQQLFSKTLPL